MGPRAGTEGLEDALADEGLHTGGEDCVGLESIGSEFLDVKGSLVGCSGKWEVCVGDVPRQRPLQT